MRQLLFLMLLAAGTLRAQEPVAKMYDDQVTLVEHDVLSLAEAMPADKYDFSPTNGTFAGVRTFGEQVKHLGDDDLPNVGARAGRAVAVRTGHAQQWPGRDPIEDPDHGVSEGLACVCPQSHGVAHRRQPHDPGGIRVRADAAVGRLRRVWPSTASITTDRWWSTRA